MQGTISSQPTGRAATGNRTKAPHARHAVSDSVALLRSQAALKMGTPRALHTGQTRSLSTGSPAHRAGGPPGRPAKSAAVTSASKKGAKSGVA